MNNYILIEKAESVSSEFLNVSCIIPHPILHLVNSIPFLCDSAFWLGIELMLVY